MTLRSIVYNCKIYKRNLLGIVTSDSIRAHMLLCRKPLHIYVPSSGQYQFHFCSHRAFKSALMLNRFKHIKLYHVEPSLLLKPTCFIVCCLYMQSSKLTPRTFGFFIVFHCSLSAPNKRLSNFCSVTKIYHA